MQGGLAFGCWRYATPYGNPLSKGMAEGEATLNPYDIIDADGVTIIAPRAEMGQGVPTRWKRWWPRKWIWTGIRSG